VIAEVPRILRQGGNVLCRQTTFWDLGARGGNARFRAHFARKAEFLFVSSEFASAAIVASHPVLVDHIEPSEAVFISSAADDPDRTLLELGNLATSFFEGWRALDRYLNPDYPARKMLAEGFGMLMRAPSPFASACKPILIQRGVRVDIPMASVPPAGRVQALLLGRSFVVAEGFRFEASAAESG
jgi:hypothetical protein